MIIGHQRQIAYFNQVMRRGKLAHAYLFYGPEHAGKFTAAKALAKFFYCEGRPAGLDKICEECLNCRRVEVNSHPGVAVLDTENTLVSKKEKRRDIPIEDIRELKRRLSLSAEGNQWRVVIVNEAERLSEDGADAFLKILEEPGEKILMILVTSSRELLLPTIISRTQPIRFSTLPDRELLGLVERTVKDPKKQELILSIAPGRPGIVQRLVNEKDYLKQELKFLKEIDAVLKEQAVPEALVFSEQVVSEDGLRQRAMEYILRILRKDLLDEAKRENAVPFMLRLKRVLEIAEIMDTTNVNPRLAMDNIFLEAMN